MMKGKCTPAMIAWVLVIIGAINWGLVGIGGFFGSEWNLVQLLLGRVEWLRDIVYILVGAAGVMSLFSCKCAKCKTCETCGAGEMKKEMPQQQM